MGACTPLSSWFRHPCGRMCWGKSITFGDLSKAFHSFLRFLSLYKSLQNHFSTLLPYIAWSFFKFSSVFFYSTVKQFENLQVDFQIFKYSYIRELQIFPVFIFTSHKILHKSKTFDISKEIGTSGWYLLKSKNYLELNSQ